MTIARALVLVTAVAFGTMNCSSAEGSDHIELRLWAMGREGEVVQSLMPEFERRNPGIRVIVQQVPWTAAHEKLLTSYVGESTPDISQLGNTWIPEFAALGALDSLDSLIQGASGLARDDFFPGIWSTNVIDSAAFGIPWYVDTRVLFYRRDLLDRAGYAKPPESWAEWTDAMRKVKALGGSTQWGVLFPLDEWAQPVILALQQGSPILKNGGRFSAVTDSAFRRAFEFYVALFKDGLAPPLANTQVANVYQDFATGTFAMYPTGPWNIGEFRTRLPATMRDKWATTPLPGPNGASSGVSIAGGSSLVLYRASKHKAEAWKLLRYLSEPEQQIRFYHLTGDLPARQSAWRDTAFADPPVRAFYTQLERVVPLPKVPEWELIATRIAAAGEAAARGKMSIDDALKSLDREINQVLEKRRWMLAKHEAP